MTTNSYQYLYDQKASKLCVGDYVKILRTSKKYENGWQYPWLPEMDAAVGTIVKVIDIDDRLAIGILTSNQWRYPFFVLERVNIPTSAMKILDI